MSARLVLVSPRRVRDAHGEERDALDVRWGSWLTAQGFVPIILSSGAPIAPFFELPRVAGVLLTGGNDLASQGGDAMSVSRDERERALVAHCTERGLGVIGVCRGLQLLAELWGFTLRKVPNHVAVRHDVTIEKGRFFSNETRSVNSYHGTGVSGASDVAVAVAHAADGSIEAIEHRTLPMAAVMWHPERDEAAVHDSDRDLFQHIFGAST